MKTNSSNEMPQTADSAAKPTRRVQFRLSTLFILLSILTCVFALLASPGMNQRSAVNSLGKFGHLTYDHQTRAGDDITKGIAARYCRSLLGPDFVDEIWAVNLRLNPSVTDETVAAPLSELTDVRSMNLDRTNVANLTLESVSRMTKIEHLSLADTGVSDDGLHHLFKLLKLKRVNLQDTAVTSDGAAELQERLPDCLVRFGPGPYRRYRKRQITK